MRFNSPKGLTGAWDLEFHYEREELYDHFSDPTEQHNIAASKPEVATRLRARIHDWMTEFNWALPDDAEPVRVIPESAKEDLRSLGYIR